MRTAAPSTVLVVDDDPVDARLCARYLEGEPNGGSRGFRVLHAATGRQALEMAAQHDLDGVLLDHHLPDHDGADLIGPLKAHACDPHLPVILLTGQGDAGVVVRALRNGAADYLGKGQLDPSAVQRAVRHGIDQARLRRRLDRKRAALVASNRALRVKTREIETFYQTVSHELKTPLAAMREYTSIMLDGIGGPLTAQQQEFLSISLGCCDRLAAHVNDLFDTARTAEGKLSLSMRDTGVDELVRNRVAEFRPAAATARLGLHLDVTGSRHIYRIDEVRIGQVLSNLLGNAIKFTEPGGEIRVRLECRPDGFALCVADNGCGIARDDLARVFERYHQGRRSATTAAGLGLGLYLSAAITRLHGGSIAVDSELGEGSCFIVEIPAA